jgi:hypothetical protein
MRTLVGLGAAAAEQVLDGLAAVTGLYYSKKFAAVVKRLGLRRDAESLPDVPRLVILQIDGLSHAHCSEALSRGVMPNLARFVRREGRLSAYQCGLPSTTPATQAGIMFGDNSEIPGFRWYDKARRVARVCRSPSFLASLQARFADTNQGLLSGGSSYVNMFDGGATRSLFTLSTLRPQRFFQGVQAAGLIGLFLLNPLRSLRFLFLVAREYLVDIYQRLTLRLKGRAYLRTVTIHTLFRIFSNVVCREIETFAVLVDMYRQVPIIYATYYSFDELGHQFGVQSSATDHALRSIDACIGQIDRFSRSTGVRYALFILGDHGLTAAQPFVERFGCTLAQVVSSNLEPDLSVTEGQMGLEHDMVGERLVLDELEAIEANLGTSASRVARRVRLLVHQHVRRQRQRQSWNLDRRHDVVVQNSGCLSHVYLSIADHRMDLGEISSAYPGLVVGLLNHEGISTVVAREGADVLILGKAGILTLGKEDRFRLEGSNPLSDLPDWHTAAAEIRRLSSYKNSGDLILMGQYDASAEQVVAFEPHRATHGGLGGPQGRPVLIYPHQVYHGPGKVRNSRHLYPWFASLRGWM